MVNSLILQAAGGFFDETIYPFVEKKNVDLMPSTTHVSLHDTRWLPERDASNEAWKGGIKIVMTHTKQAEMPINRSPTLIYVLQQHILFAVPLFQSLAEGEAEAYRQMKRSWEFAPLCSTLFASDRVRYQYPNLGNGCCYCDCLAVLHVLSAVPTLP